MSQRGIDDGALASPQATVTQVTIDDAENPSRQVGFFQQAADVEDRGFIQSLFHRRMAVAKPVLPQVHAQHRH